MASTYSTMLPLGTKAPDFKLLDTVSDKLLSLSNVKAEKGTVVMFICNHCPYVIHVLDEVLAIAGEYQSKGISFVAISSNDVVNYPEDGPEQMKIKAKEKAFSFPYLYDETQEIAKAYQAACTPDFYVFDSEVKCVYRGRLDASTPRNGQPLTGKDLRNALDAVLLGDTVKEDEQMPSLGCNIKWKS
ncbi:MULTISPECIES: thioredoxin family protein [unclassified Imperialibacter]|uniref:thioredoxin family protein n=1 Tax=unclassified Imperialibacter TaxID=2629706 RepID=UPI00125BE1A6|nr:MULTISPECIES: thioredoxin family protein [unclassified Imperialibacter]CAD5274631.1 Thioredoxin family protein [Imperialibacter sp. 75]CAD5288304.1 Thioredoxin family protein [Imperialibacter sp. 89]VVT35606.1 Thioredoxin family protein [Imperialibacter sp. EC-SDR9]